MDRFEALKAITVNPALLLGVDGEVGTLEPGKRADIVVFDSDPLTIAAKPAAVFAQGKAIINRLNVYRSGI